MAPSGRWCPRPLLDLGASVVISRLPTQSARDPRPPHIASGLSCGSVQTWWSIPWLPRRVSTPGAISRDSSFWRIPSSDRRPLRIVQSRMRDEPVWASICTSHASYLAGNGLFPRIDHRRARTRRRRVCIPNEIQGEQPPILNSNPIQRTTAAFPEQLNDDFVFHARVLGNSAAPVAYLSASGGEQGPPFASATLVPTGSRLQQRRVGRPSIWEPGNLARSTARFPDFQFSRIPRCLPRCVPARPEWTPGGRHAARPECTRVARCGAVAGRAWVPPWGAAAGRGCSHLGSPEPEEFIVREVSRRSR